MINLHTNTQTIKELEALGITNHYKHSSLPTQRFRLLRDAANLNLITLKP